MSNRYSDLVVLQSQFNEAASTVSGYEKSTPSPQGFGVVSGLEVTADALSLSVTAGVFVTPAGIRGEVLAVSGLVLPSYSESSVSVIGVRIVDSEVQAEDPYGAEVRAYTVREAKVFILDFDTYLALPDSEAANTVALAVCDVKDGQPVVDATRTTYAFVRPLYSPADVKHRASGRPDMGTPRNPHGLQIDDLDTSSIPLLGQIFPESFLLSNSRGLVGELRVVSISATAWRPDYLGEFVGVPGKYFVELPSTPVAVERLVDADGYPVGVEWIKATRYLYASEPVAVVAAYREIADFDLKHSPSGGSIDIRGNSRNGVVGGKTLYADASTRTLDTTAYGSVPVPRAEVWVTAENDCVLAPSVVGYQDLEGATESTFAAQKLDYPCQLGFVVTGSKPACLMPPDGSLKVTGWDFAGRHNFTYTVSTPEVRTRLYTDTWGPARVLAPDASAKLYVGGYLAANGVAVSESWWRLRPELGYEGQYGATGVIAVLPSHFDSNATYEWVVPATESSRYLGRKIEARGRLTPRASANPAGYLVGYSNAFVDGDSVTIEVVTQNSGDAATPPRSLGMTMKAVAGGYIVFDFPATTYSPAGYVAADGVPVGSGVWSYEPNYAGGDPALLLDVGYYDPRQTYTWEIPASTQHACKAVLVAGRDWVVGATLWASLRSLADAVEAHVGLGPVLTPQVWTPGDTGTVLALVAASDADVTGWSLSVSIEGAGVLESRGWTPGFTSASPALLDLSGAVLEVVTAGVPELPGLRVNLYATSDMDYSGAGDNVATAFFLVKSLEIGAGGRKSVKLEAADLVGRTWGDTGSLDVTDALSLSLQVFGSDYGGNRISEALVLDEVSACLPVWGSRESKAGLGVTTTRNVFSAVTNYVLLSNNAGSTAGLAVLANNGSRPSVVLPVWEFGWDGDKVVDVRDIRQVVTSASQNAEHREKSLVFEAFSFGL